MRRTMLAAFTILILAASVRAADFQPDPRSVQCHGAGYRYPQAGWIVLHIEGEPYERGYQHGRLLAPEIVSYAKCFAAMQSPKAPTEGWESLRTLVNALFVRRFDKEFLEEMKGIADGAAAAGAKFDDRPIDLIDIVAINCWAEVETLDAALEATPTGLEGIRFPKQQPRKMPAPKPMHCSAFAAVGPATKDGKIVFGHVTMFDLYPSLHFNVWLDVKPAKGQRIVMQSYPGGIQSGMDYYINDAGILLLETTIAQTRFNQSGLTVASRTRKALQYARSIDQAVEILQKDNNGLYTNEWMLADVNANEIAMFELGTTKSKLYRSSKNEWFGGTEGFYWGCNNTKDLQVRLDTVASVDGRPANVVFRPDDRDIRWQQLYARFKGKIDADFGRAAFTTFPLCSSITIDAKYTTTDLAKQLKSHALFGPPLGKTWQPTDEEKKDFPEIRPLVANPWTILHAAPPDKGEVKGPPVVDLPDKIADAGSGDKEGRRQSLLRSEDRSLPTVPAWHGTILPRTDADIWLAAAFADYERIVALETALEEKAKDGKLGADERDRLALELFAHRAGYLSAARVKGDVALAKTQAQLGSDEWYRIASGKGVLALHTLRGVLGAGAFSTAMDSFGRASAGQPVTVEQFRKHLAPAHAENFFSYWTNETGLPRLQLAEVSMKRDGKEAVIAGTVKRTDAGPTLFVQVTLETDKGEQTESIKLEGLAGTFKFQTNDAPRRVVVDKYGMTARANGGHFSVLAFHREPEQTLIVYGTADEDAANKETAETLQEAIRTTWCNCTVAIKSDQAVTDDDLKKNHLLLVGRPDCNRIVQRVRASLPIDFGPCSFVVRGEAHAHAHSGVIVAAENPANPRYSVVVLAGLSAEATTRLPAVLLKKDQKDAEAIVWSAGQAKLLVLPAKELVKELGEEVSMTTAYDGIILGTGHNSLVLQAYLCRCGLRVLSLERLPVAGGGLATEENPRLPGFRHNTHSFFHRGINKMPWYADLQLAYQGAEYIEPELNVAMILPDGRSLEWWTDLPRTVASFAEFSERDAATLHRWVVEFQPIVEHILVPEAQAPPLLPERRRELLARSHLGRALLAVSKQSPLDFVTREFENDVIRAGLLFFNGLREIDLRLPGFGYAIPALLAAPHKAQMCLGGAARLAQALVGDIRAHGGEVRTGIELKAIRTRQGKAVGVELADGEQIEAKAFVASGLNPVQTFVDYLDPDAVPAPTRDLAAKYQYNLIGPLFALNLALKEPPLYRAAEDRPELTRAFMVVLGLERFDQFAKIVECHERGTIPPTVMWGAAPTVFDPTQAPPDQHTAFMWEKLPYALGGNPQSWDAAKDAHGQAMLALWSKFAPNLAGDTVLDSFTRSPLDTERLLPNMHHGDLLVGSFAGNQIGHNRPFAGAGRYRTPVAGLYLCGAATHPGGNVTGLCGYNAASVVAADLGLTVWWKAPRVEELWQAL